ncbi:hypothetical protein CLOM_g9260 [Closterium sp. NIES-68]|nr:hypothetical protein CLOM_g9260 [Closterium sp. NIES-68]GJP76165.1 hypothetical protein CLOP_g6536 [Closterium sp. NIES-67]
MASCKLIRPHLDISSRQSRAVLRSADLDLLALEGRLSLLDAQRELNAIRCEQFVTRLQSFLREGESEGDELRDNWEPRRGRRMSSRYSHSREAAAVGRGDIPRAQSVPEIGGQRAPRSSHGGRSARSQGLGAERLTRWASCEQHLNGEDGEW